MDIDLLSRVLFPRPSPSYNVHSFPGELLWVPRSLNPQTSSPEDCIPLCMLQYKGAGNLVVYLHSNFEDIGRCYGFCDSLRNQLKVHVLITEYPGYGICPGTHCDEHAATECAHVALRFASEVLRWPQSRTILLGRSIGTGPATLLASKYRYAGLVLVCPFLSVQELVRGYVGPAASFVRERFPSQEHIKTVRAACLIVHGDSDSMIPVSQGQKLYELCKSRKCFVSPSGMDHNADLMKNPNFFLKPMQDFFDLPRLEDIELFVPNWAFDKQLCPQFFYGVGLTDSGDVKFTLSNHRAHGSCAGFGVACGSGCSSGRGGITLAECGGCRSCKEDSVAGRMSRGTPIGTTVFASMPVPAERRDNFVEATIVRAVDAALLADEPDVESALGFSGASQEEDNEKRCTVDKALEVVVTV